MLLPTPAALGAPMFFHTTSSEVGSLILEPARRSPARPRFLFHTNL